MDENAFVVAEIAELVRLDFVFLGFIVIHIAFAGTVAPRAFYDPFFPDEIGGLNGISFVGGTENQAVAKIQRQNL